MGQLALEAATALLGHKNPETELMLKEDPALAWVTLLGETSLFDLPDHPGSLPEAYAKKLRDLQKRAPSSAGHRFWESVESAHLKKMADALHNDDFRGLIAGISHWRREPEFVAAQGSLDLIDDRVYWPPLPWSSPETRSMLFAPSARALDSIAAQKHPAGRPYVLGQWCSLTTPAWSFPDESADFMLGTFLAMNADWDGLVRRGVFLFPVVWGAGPAGTVGGEDIFQIAEVTNASPHIFVPLATRRFAFPARTRRAGRGQGASRRGRQVGKQGTAPACQRMGFRPRPALFRHALHPGAQPAGSAVRPLRFRSSSSRPKTRSRCSVATSLSNEPIGSTKRLLVTAIANVEPKDFRWVNEWKRDVADPGHPPFLQEPVVATVTCAGKDACDATSLTTKCAAISPVALEGLPGGEGVTLKIDGKTPAFHWEFTVE